MLRFPGGSPVRPVSCISEECVALGIGHLFLSRKRAMARAAVAPIVASRYRLTITILVDAKRTCERAAKDGLSAMSAAVVRWRSARVRLPPEEAAHVAASGPTAT